MRLGAAHVMETAQRAAPPMFTVKVLMGFGKPTTLARAPLRPAILSGIALDRASPGSPTGPRSRYVTMVAFQRSVTAHGVQVCRGHRTKTGFLYAKGKEGSYRLICTHRGGQPRGSAGAAQKDAAC